MNVLESFFDKYSLPTRILATSLGGVYAGVASKTNLSEIMANSSLPDLVKLKKERFAFHGFTTNAENAQGIKENLSTEASNFKEDFKAKKLLVIRTNSINKPF